MASHNIQKLAERIYAEEITLEQAAAETGWPIDADGDLVAPGWFADDGNAEVHFPAAASGAGAAQEYVNGGDWGEEPGSIDVRACRYYIEPDGTLVSWAESSHGIDLNTDPEEPDCVEGEDHDWQSPGWLGGCSENPGVWLTGGTSGESLTVCAHCGAYRRHEWTGTQKNPGEASEVTSYEDADERSREWAGITEAA